MDASVSSEQQVKERYSKAAQEREDALCCPTAYDPKYLSMIPEEIIQKDYGCGNPSEYLKEGEVVLDLGSGAGKICYIAAQIVGANGKVIGVDMNDDMLTLARKYQNEVAEKLGYANVKFVKAKIQDLKLDLQRLNDFIKDNPGNDLEGYQRIADYMEELRASEPLIADSSVDVVVSNCVLNLVDNSKKRELFQEIFRVLRKGGRAVISDIVSDEEVPIEMQRNPDLWSGCISGAMTEDGFLKSFVDAGFYGVRILKRAPVWRTIQGIEFRSYTVEAFKGKQGPCKERNQAVIYKGPFSAVIDDDNHRLERGQRVAVCDKTYNIYKKAPYRDFFEFVDPVNEIPLEEAHSFDCATPHLRPPKVTKGDEYTPTFVNPAGECCPGGNCG